MSTATADLPKPVTHDSAVLRLNKTGKWYPDPDQPKLKSQILRNIDLKVDKADFVTVVGASGCGKSTLLAGIGGFTPFNEGTAEIRIGEKWEPIGEPNRHRGVVFQDYPVPEFLTARDNVALGPNLHRLGLLANSIPWLARKAKAGHYELADELIQNVGLAEHAHKFPGELSGGQRQRVAIAQAMAMHPEILLMDEPFSGLDPTSRENLQVLVQKLHSRLKNTIFFVTHDLEEAVYLGTRIIVLAKEKRPKEGSPDELENIPGAVIIHEQTLEEYKTPESKGSKEFAELVRFLRTKITK
jgi:NitT/TauT family transport system ATP-binding protein